MPASLLDLRLLSVLLLTLSSVGHTAGTRYWLLSLHNSLSGETEISFSIFARKTRARVYKTLSPQKLAPNSK